MKTRRSGPDLRKKEKKRRNDVAARKKWMQLVESREETKKE